MVCTVSGLQSVLTGADCRDDSVYHLLVVSSCVAMIQVAIMGSLSNLRALAQASEATILCRNPASRTYASQTSLLASSFHIVGFKSALKKGFLGILLEDDPGGWQRSKGQ